MQSSSPAVVVVGAGPTGLTLASELIRHGVTCRVVEEVTAAATFSKAALVHSRTMEACDDMGLATQLLARSKTISRNA